MLLMAVLLAVALAGLYAAWTAARVDRLHARAAAAGRALDAHLVRRAAAAAVLAEQLPAPGLYTVARSALDGAGDREAAENDLTRQLQCVAGRCDLSEPVRAACRRVAVARQVHTDLVRDALAVRRQRLVRLLRLDRRHACPAYFDIQDPALAAPAPVLVPAGAPGAGPRPAPVVVKQATGQATGV
ncbi:hypothetical protein GCM10010123_14750 [Pilimelia anulata]|uniref:Uncharacterized protein n=2 Tax=Pilimelia anulata TaxID=53371 RepID=A0A8J3F9F3_9ACTN|nr:hypothetical protein [Pilimelia anulata]GGJ86206.1 hypothetical protein GCM10010123_14750 [Pilimelia anulata]